MNSVDAPVCVVKRFRRQCPAAPQTPPGTELPPELSAGSFELVTGPSDSPEVDLWPDVDALSSIAPVDLFAAASEPDVTFNLVGQTWVRMILIINLEEHQTHWEQLDVGYPVLGLPAPHHGSHLRDRHAVLMFLLFRMRHCYGNHLWLLANHVLI